MENLENQPEIVCKAPQATHPLTTYGYTAYHAITPDILAAMVFNDKQLNNMNNALIRSSDIVLMIRDFYARISTLWRIFLFKNVLLVLTFMKCEINWY